MQGASITYTYVRPIFVGMPGQLQRSDMPNTYIPLDLLNMDYQAFLSWIAKGNDPPEGWTGPTNPTEKAR